MIKAFLQPSPKGSWAKSGFSMIEILMVVGIIGIIMGLGSVSYVKQINKNRVETTTIKIESMLKQARQMSIAMRLSRRVVIDVGEVLDGEDNDGDGLIDEPGVIWTEGKKSELKNYSDAGNIVEITDRDRLVDGVMVVDVDGKQTKTDKVQLLYIEFNSRGQVDNVYFEGGEKGNHNLIAPVLHITRSNESFEINKQRYSYWNLTESILKSTSFSDAAQAENANQRYKVQTLEVVRLTGRTRRYDYGVFSPWPNDQPSTN